MARKKKVKVPTNVPDDPGTPDVDESVEEVEVDDTESAEGGPGHDVNEVLDPEKHVAIHLGGDTHKIMLLSEFPGQRPYGRTLSLNGQVLEHTHEHRGVWAYRHLG